MRANGGCAEGVDFQGRANGGERILWLTGEACWHEIIPGLFLGRRALGGELPAGVELIVDLTAEFPEPRIVRSTVDYRCLPTLDAFVPDLDRLRELVAEVAAFPGRVYVHCALGHGRSALVVAAVLLARGVAADPKTAVTMVRAARTSIRLNRVQLSSLRLLAAGRANPEPPQRAAPTHVW